MVKQRRLNIEYLRILAMLGIVLSHFAVHGLYTSDEPTTISLINDSLSIFGGIGVNIYAMITAWFMWQKDFKLSRVLTIIRDIYTYIIGGFLVFLVVIRVTGKFSHLIYAERVYNTVMPLGREYWYLTAYIILLMVLPLLNTLLGRLTQSQHKALNLTLITLFTLVPMVGFAHKRYFKVVLLLPYLYSLMAYYKRFGIPSKGLAVKYTLAGLGLSMGSILWFNLLASYLPNLYDIRRVYLHHEDPGILLLSIGLFFLFYHWDVKVGGKMQGLVLWVSSSTLGVYLLHEHPMVRSILYKAFDNREYSDSILSYLLAATLFTVTVFMVGILVDKVKVYLLDPLTKKLIKRWG